MLGIIYLGFARETEQEIILELDEIDLDYTKIECFECSGSGEFILFSEKET